MDAKYPKIGIFIDKVDLDRYTYGHSLCNNFVIYLQYIHKLLKRI